MHRLSAKRPLAADEFIEHHSEAEQIAPSIQSLPADLFRRHVAGGSEQYSSARLEPRSHARIAGAVGRNVFFGKFGQAKVEHLRVTIRPQHDVFRLDVAV